MIVKIREPVNGWTHFFAAALALIGLIFLVLVGWHSLIKEISLSVYGLSLILLFTASATYHMVKGKPEIIAILRKLDHSAIFILIAGTYTPFCMIMFSGFWKWGLLTIIWSLALIGIIVKIFVNEAPRWLHAGIYVMMGWLCMTAISEMLRVVPPGGLAWLIIGGVIYTAGAIVYVTKTLDFIPGKFGFYEVWHIFVIMGALAHFIAVAVYIAPHTI